MSIFYSYIYVYIYIYSVYTIKVGFDLIHDLMEWDHRADESGMMFPDKFEKGIIVGHDISKKFLDNLFERLGTTKFFFTIIFE